MTIGPMHPDLQNLIRLQKLDLAAEEANRAVNTAPERIAALDALLHTAQDALAAAKARKAENEEQRRAVEKDRSAIRARRSKYQDQTMEVKTNREFHAMQKEIEVADHEIARLDDQDLELMVAADDIAGAIKACGDRVTGWSRQGFTRDARARTDHDRRCPAARHPEFVRRPLAHAQGYSDGRSERWLVRGVQRAPAGTDLRTGTPQRQHHSVREL
jgi:predicted transcriptional regulator